MSATGAGYDLSNTTYSPDGRVFQVEYAQKAVEKSGTVIGVCCKDGVVLGVQKQIPYRMLVPGTSRRIATIGRSAGMATAGIAGDSRRLVLVGREEAASYKTFYGNDAPTSILAHRVAGEVHNHTLYWHVRPFGASVLLAGHDVDNGFSLHLIQPTGDCFKYKGTAIGSNMAAAKTEIEKLDLSEMLARDAVDAIAKIIYKLQDGTKDDEFELEMSWLTEESQHEHVFVPAELVASAKIEAIAARDAEDEDSDED